MPDTNPIIYILITALIFIVILIIMHLSAKKREALLHQQNANLAELINSDGLTLQKRVVELEAQIHSKAQSLYYEWRDKEIDVIKAGTIRGHRSAVAGQVAERFVPFMPVFTTRYNPKDARFIGSSIDLIIFNGADDREIREIVFVEVKTGHSSLTRRQQQIRNIIEDNKSKIRWEQIKI